MFTLTIFGFGPENGSTKGTLGMKFEPECLAFGGVDSIQVGALCVILNLPSSSLNGLINRIFKDSQQI